MLSKHPLKLSTQTSGVQSLLLYADAKTKIMIWFPITPAVCRKCKVLSELYKAITGQSNFSRCHSETYLTSHTLFFAVYVAYKKCHGKNNTEFQEKTDNEMEPRSSFHETNKGFQPDEK